MWQRIQTVFLVLLIIVLLISLVQPIWHFADGETEVVLTPFYFLEKGSANLYTPYAIIAILTIACITIAFTSARKFKDRVLQMKLGAFNSLLLVGVIGGSVYFAMELAKNYEGGTYGPGLYLPGAAVLFNMLANFFIRRDEKLVRNSDRLR